MQNLIDKKNSLLVRFGMVKSLNFAAFSLDSVSLLNISSLLKLYRKKFGKFNWYIDILKKLNTNFKWSYSKTTIEETCSFCTALFTVFFYHIKNTRHIKKQLLTMIAKFICKTKNNGWCQRKARFQKALRLMVNDIWNDMLCYATCSQVTILSYINKYLMSSTIFAERKMIKLLQFMIMNGTLVLLLKQVKYQPI